MSGDGRGGTRTQGPFGPHFGPPNPEVPKDSQCVENLVKYLFLTPGSFENYVNYEVLAHGSLENHVKYKVFARGSLENHIKYELFVCGSFETM